MRKALLYLAFLTTLPAQQPPDYTRDIQPIFEKNCYACHGPAQQSAGLRLDRPDDAVARKSEILNRVSGAPGKARMPLGGRLTDPQIALLTTWVQSAVKPKHWAFIPPIRPAIPAVSQKAWVRNPIDAFILARLESEGLRPSPEPTAQPSSAVPLWISSASRPRPPNSTPFCPTAAQTPMRSRLTASSPHLTTAKSGPATGWMRRATPIRTATRRTSRASSGFIAIG